MGSIDPLLKYIASKGINIIIKICILLRTLDNFIRIYHLLEMTFSAEFHCHRGDFAISADQLCDGINDCPGADEDHYNCPNETNDKDNNINEITSKN